MKNLRKILAKNAYIMSTQKCYNKGILRYIKIKVGPSMQVHVSLSHVKDIFKPLKITKSSLTYDFSLLTILPSSTLEATKKIINYLIKLISKFKVANNDFSKITA